MKEHTVEASLRSLPDPEGPLPAADLVWRRALVRARLRRYERATRPVRAAQAAGAAACLLLGFVCLGNIAPRTGAVDPALANWCFLAIGAMTAAVVWLVRALFEDAR